MITSRDQLQRAISDKKAKLKDKDVFTSSAFRRVCENILKGVGKIFNIPSFALAIEYGKPEGSVAYATGDCKFYLNVNNALVANKKMSRTQKYEVLLGILCHETAHRLWTDFKAGNKICNDILAGNLQLASVKVLSDYLSKHPELRPAIAKIHAEISNSIEDGYIEARFMNTFRGYRKYVLAARAVHQAGANGESPAEQRANGVEPLRILMNAILYYAKFGIMPENDDPEISEAFEIVTDIIDEALSENAGKDRERKYLKVTQELVLFYEEQKNQQSQSGNSSNNTSNDVSEQSGPNNSNALSNLADSIKDSDEETAKAHNYSPISSDEEQESTGSSIAGQGAFQEQQNSESPTNGSKDELERIEESLAHEKVAQDQEAQIRNELNTLAATMDFGNYHNGIRSEICRNLNSDPSKDYSELETELKTILRRLIREWKKQIKDIQLGENLNGLYSGRRVSQPHRTDLKRFSTRKAPTDIPNMSLILLIDMSGSMYGGRDEAARKTALLVSYFCREMGIRFACYGHREASSNSDVVLYSFAEFDCIDNKDDYRISNLKEYVSSRNRDGYAIRFCAEKLSKETSEQKILMIISDGAPNAENYGYAYYDPKPTGYTFEMSGNAKCDIADILRIYRKKGISFIAAGLGADSEVIKDLYTYGISEKIAAKFLDITDLEKMPKMFIELLKKEILP